MILTHQLMHYILILNNMHLEYNYNFKIMKKIFLYILVLLCINSSCRPEFLDIKRDLAQVVPQGYDDFLAILSNDLMLTFSPHQLSMIGSDEYYILDGQWASLSDPVQKNAYVWGDDIYEGASSLDWNRGYEKIAYANFVLDELSNNEKLSSSQKRHLEGLAYYYRGLNLYYLYQIFCDY